MEFFPLTLGIPKPRPTREEQEPGSGASRWTYEAWREGLSGPEEETEAYAAEDVLFRLLQNDAVLPKRPWVILGEPGAGKTSLLEHWHATWLRALPQPHLGMRVPVLVRLRDVSCNVLVGDPAAAADTLWEKGLVAGQAEARDTAAAIVFALPKRVFTPVWLLDGLDELAAPIADRGLWDMLRALPGDVVMTCRTAVFQPARAEVVGRVGNEWCILGLKPGKEQADFLTRAYAAAGWAPTRAVAIVRELNTNPALRPLAAVPMLLGLVAEAGPDLILPATRADFYEDATNALWARRLSDRPELLDLAPERDCALAALAALMGLPGTDALSKGALDIRLDALHRTGAAPELRTAMRRTGLLRFDDRRGRVSFPHLTFHEFHLARAMLEQPFGDVLRKHWREPRYEEVLALLIALHARDGRTGMIEAELRGFVIKAREDHACNPRRLRSHGRSPLRTILHLLARAAVSPGPALPATLLDEPMLLRVAVAVDQRAPGTALAELARDPDEKVRRRVARNTAAPAAVLAELARDPDTEVRRALAWNAAAPEAVLVELTCDRNREVRRALTWNAAAPEAVLAELACDRDREVRQRVAENAATPAMVLAFLARDANTEVRQRVAENTATPAVVLAKLARDPVTWVRMCVATNAATPEAVLAELARDPDIGMVGWRMAENAAAVLAELARDPNTEVRWQVAGNAAAPAAALAELARDPDTELRQRVAGNAAAPEAVLTKLARDSDTEVRRTVAGNAAAPAEALAELARDPDTELRQRVAGNAAAPEAVLTKLARDSDTEVRRTVAGNAAAPAEALAELARDLDTLVRRMVAGNTAAPAEALAELARDLDTLVRQGVAWNAATPAAALAELARDSDTEVRWRVAENAGALLEDLAVEM